VESRYRFQKVPSSQTWKVQNGSWGPCLFLILTKDKGKAGFNLLTTGKCKGRREQGAGGYYWYLLPKRSFTRRAERVGDESRRLRSWIFLASRQVAGERKEMPNRRTKRCRACTGFWTWPYRPLKTFGVNDEASADLGAQLQIVTALFVRKRTSERRKMVVARGVVGLFRALTLRVRRGVK